MNSEIKNDSIDVNEEENQELELEFYLEKLNDLIGLKEVKKEVEKLTNYLKFYKRVSDKSNMDKINLNMIFKGNQVQVKQLSPELFHIFYMV